MSKVTIYTDGACSGNPGPGGWGAVLIYGEHRKEVGGGEKQTTNNRMEITAAIKALELLKMPCEVELYSDSAYLVDAHNKNWIRGWIAKGWKHKTDKGLQEVLNVDLWKRLTELEAIHKVSYIKVSGHSGVDENERCDKIATGYASQYSVNEVAEE